MGKGKKHSKKSSATPAAQAQATITMSPDELKKIIAEAIVEAEKSKEDFSKYKTTAIIAVLLMIIFIFTGILFLVFGCAFFYQVVSAVTWIQRIGCILAMIGLFGMGIVFFCAAGEMWHIKDSAYLWGAFTSIIAVLALIVSIVGVIKGG